MGILRKNQFIFWNIFALILVKAAFSYIGPQFADLANNFSDFTKEEIVSQTNFLRLSSGLKELKESSLLNLAASQKLQDMISGQYFAHISPKGVTPWHWFEINKYGFSYAGENLALGFWNASDTVKAWANSPSHRDNLLNSNFQETGVAVVQTKIGDTSGFLVVQLFGTPKNKISQITAKIPVQNPAKLNVLPETQNLQPTIITTTPLAGKFDKTTKILNNIFVLYALVLFLVSVLTLVFIGLSRALISRAAISFALVILSLAIPVIHVIHSAMIL